MAYIVKDDLKTKSTVYQLDQILEDDDLIIDIASDDAQAIVTDSLHQHYDTELIFSKTGSARDKNVVIWMKHIVMYLIFERIPDEGVPERMVKDYDDVMIKLGKIAEGRAPVNLPSRTTKDESGNTVKKTKFQWGGGKERSR